MICDNCKKDGEINCVLDLKDYRTKRWVTFHFCGIRCLTKFISEHVEVVGDEGEGFE
jgi:hypothetical protein